MVDAVPIVIDGERVVIDAHAATILAENLRVTAHNRDDFPDARDAADAIEAVLVEQAEEAVADDATADAIFYELNVTAGTGASPAVIALYVAVRKVHNRLLGWP